MNPTFFTILHHRRPVAYTIPDMKTLYTFCLILGFAFTGFAQDFLFNGDQHVTIEMDGYTATEYIYISTPAPEAITYEFVQESNTMPIEWQFSLCDYTNCYIGIPNSGTMTPISLSEAEGGTEGYFMLTIMNQGISGSGTVELWVYDSNDYERGAFVSWTVNYVGEVSVDENAAAAIQVYPNPTTDVLNVKVQGAFTGEILNELGQNVLALKGTSTQSFDVSGLDAGIYFVSIQTATGDLMRQRLVVQ